MGCVCLDGDDVLGYVLSLSHLEFCEGGTSSEERDDAMPSMRFTYHLP